MLIPRVEIQRSPRPKRGMTSVPVSLHIGDCSIALLRVRHAVDVDDIGQRAHAAIAAGDWTAVRLLLHPYLHWTDRDARTICGRSQVLAMLKRAARAPAEARSIELRDGQIYRWHG